MLIKDLIKQLSKLNPEALLVLQADQEGNAYSPLLGAEGDCIYKNGEVYSTDTTAEDNGLEEDEWQELKSSESRCVVLYP